MHSGFLNADLELEAGSNLELLAIKMGKNVIVLYSGPANTPKRHLLVMETARQYKSPDSAINSLCLMAENLSPTARHIWNSARKALDIGYEMVASEKILHFALRPNTLERIARLGISLAVTCYRREDTKPEKKGGKSRCPPATP